MATRTRKQKLPVVYPSVPDIESKPGVHDEPAPPARPDRMPPGRLRISPQRSRAALRLRIEQLLLRRDSIPEKEWAELGDEGRELLVELVDDPAIRSHDALRHRAIAVLGHLGVRSAIVPLNAILSSRTEAPVTRAYAATALGHIGGQGAVPGLATSLGDEDDMVRRQVAKALASAQASSRSVDCRGRSRGGGDPGMGEEPGGTVGQGDQGPGADGRAEQEEEDLARDGRVVPRL